MKNSIEVTYIRLDLSLASALNKVALVLLLILQNNVGNCFSPTIIIAAITSVSKKAESSPRITT